VCMCKEQLFTFKINTFRFLSVNIYQDFINVTEVIHLFI